MPIKKQPSITVRIPQEQYPKFRESAPGDAYFPATYEQWMQQRKRRDEDKVSRGESLKEVVVEHADFIAYCDVIQQRPSDYLLLACATALNGGWKP